MRAFAYHRPESLAAALRLKQRLPAARFIAGGTDLLVKMKSGALVADELISLRGLTELSAIASDETGATIGALTPLSEVLEHPRIRRDYPVLAAAAAAVANPRVRNAATLGGNFCNASPCADTPPALIVLGARMIIEGPRGRREVPAEDFFVAPGRSCLESDEILAAIALAPPLRGSRAVFQKHGRTRVDLSLVNAALLAVLEGTRFVHLRVAAGAVGPVPLRLSAVERLLEGREATPELLARAEELASEAVSPISDVRGGAAYRRRISGVLVRRGLERLLGWRAPA